MAKQSAFYTLAFMTAVCVVCSVLVSTAAVGLRDRQQVNAILDKQRNVLSAIGAIKPAQRVSAERISELFSGIEVAVVDLGSGEYVDDIEGQSYDQQRALKDPELSRPAPANNAGITRVPLYGVVYKVMEEESLDSLVIPIEGMGLWSTLYGFIALDADGVTVRGITFYQHGETPGLGGEVDNPRWKGLWPGRKVFGEDGAVRISLIKGQAGPPAEDPYRVDGLSGATMTYRGVEAMLHFWLGDEGFGPYLRRFRDG